MRALPDARAKWGVPDWTRADAYPPRTTDREWSWEFVRRRPDYREAWERWKTTVASANGVTFARTDDPDATYLRFGVRVIYDPRRLMTDHDLRTASFFEAMQFILWDDPFLAICELEKEGAMAEASARLSKKEEAKRAAGLKDYRFNLNLPLEPQLNKARACLLDLQAKMYGKKATPRPRRNNWPLFRRALDARDCDATYAEMTAAFWPRVDHKTEQSARDIYKRAVELRDKSRINWEFWAWRREPDPGPELRDNSRNNSQ